MVADGFLLRSEESLVPDAWRDFFLAHRATVDVSGGSSNSIKANGMPPILLESLAERVSRYVPTGGSAKLGCIEAADQIVGAGSKGVYDILLPPTLPSSGYCLVPDSRNGTYRMEWTYGDENQDAAMTMKNQLPPVEDVYNAVFARQGPAVLPPPGEPSLNFWFLSFVNWFHDDNFRTQPMTDGALLWNDVAGLRLSQVYGHTIERESALRLFVGGN